MPYANDYGPTFHIFDYIRKLTPPKTHEESNLMANELSDIRRIDFPKLSTKSIDAKYLCNKSIEAKIITYTNESNGKKEVVKNEQ